MKSLILIVAAVFFMGLLLGIYKSGASKRELGCFTVLLAFILLVLLFFLS